VTRYSECGCRTILRYRSPSRPPLMPLPPFAAQTQVAVRWWRLLVCAP
jgi:hypothetical protein